MPDHVSRPETLGLSPGSGFISISSATELQSHFYVALDRKYVIQETFDKIYRQAEKVGKMVSNLITYLRQCDRKFNETKQTR